MSAKRRIEGEQGVKRQLNWGGDKPAVDLGDLRGHAEGTGAAALGQADRSQVLRRKKCFRHANGASFIPMGRSSNGSSRSATSS
jgi:hypothetical protein